MNNNIINIEMKSEYIKLTTHIVPSNQKLKNAKIFNYGLAILKTIHAFLVLAFHNFNYHSTKNKIIIFITRNRRHHVPSFYIISFYFMALHLYSLNLKALIKRIVRLLIPYIGWPIIFYKLNRFINLKCNKNLPDSNEELKMQLLLGNRFIHPFWFQFDMIVITILLFIIIFIFRKFSLFIFRILLILIYAIEYSGKDYTIYVQKYLKHDKYLLRFFLESTPYPITGFLLGFYKVLDIIQKQKIETLILSFLIYKIISDYNIFRKFKDSPYPGIHLNIQSICLIFIFSLFPSHYITNKYIKIILNILTSYTAGIFYLHVPIRAYLRDYSYHFKKGTFIGIIQEYLICYSICFIGMNIFGDTPLKYMFS